MIFQLLVFTLLTFFAGQSQGGNNSSLLDEKLCENVSKYLLFTLNFADYFNFTFANKLKPEF